MDLKNIALMGLTLLVVALFSTKYEHSLNNPEFKVEGIQLGDKMDRPAFETFDNNFPKEGNTFPPMIRLIDKKTPNNPSGFICSATVISNEYALTAAHCLTDENYKMKSEIGIESQQAYNQDDTFIDEQVAKPIGINMRADYALIRGDFTRYQKVSIDAKPDWLNRVQQPPVTCGFPWGAKFTCYDTAIQNTYICHSAICAIGVLYPGMSGGPVIDPGTMTVIGVNSATLEGGYVRLMPLVGIFETFDIENRDLSK